MLDSVSLFCRENFTLNLLGVIKGEYANVANKKMITEANRSKGSYYSHSERFFVRPKVIFVLL